MQPNKKGYNIKVSPRHINLDSDLTLTILDSEILVEIKKGIRILALARCTPGTIFAIWHIKGSSQHQLLHFYFPSAVSKVVIINCNNNYYYKGPPHIYRSKTSLFSRNNVYIYTARQKQSERESDGTTPGPPLLFHKELNSKVI